MIAKLQDIKTELDKITVEVRNNAELPSPDQAVAVNIAVNAVRTAVIELDIALHARHNERHPIKASPYSVPRITSSCDVLTPDVRADIDATP